MDPTGRLLDQLAANATPASMTWVVDGWLCKLAPDLPFRRANAVLPPTGAGRDRVGLDSALGEIENRYSEANERVLVQVSSADPTATDLDAFLAARGYVIEAPVDLMVGDSREVLEQAAAARDRFGDAAFEAWSGARADGRAGRSILETSSDGWCNEEWAAPYLTVHGDDHRSRDRTLGYARMLSVIGPGVLACTTVVDPDAEVRSSRQVAGLGFAVLERGWAGVFGMYTAPSWRGRGVASTLLGTIAAAAHRKARVRRLYLQVETDNVPAQALYRGLGFTRHHGYHYRVSAPA